MMATSSIKTNEDIITSINKQIDSKKQLSSIVIRYLLQ